MAFSIDGFKQAIGGIQRPTLFEVFVVGQYFTSTDLFRFTCKSATTPNSTLGVIPVPYMGRTIKYAGDRTYADWTTTVIINNDWESYKKIYNWHTAINGVESNLSVTNNMNSLKASATVHMYAHNSESPNAVFKLHGLFPYDMQAINLDWATTDTTTDVAVTWAYDYATME